MAKNPDDANNMGGPSFHPEPGKGDKTAKKEPRDTMDKKQDGAILTEDQVPPL